MWTFVILLGVLAIAVIAGFLHLQKRADEAAARSHDWPTVTGRVVQNMLVTTYGRHAPVVAYAYSVDGRDYRRSRIRFGNYTNMNKADAEAILARYPDGGPVEVHYDPDEPGTAVLEPGPAGRSWRIAAWAIGGPLLLLALIFALLAAAAGRS